MQEKTSKDWKRRFLIYCSWGLCSKEYLQLPFIRVEKTVSWFHFHKNLWVPVAY